MTELVNPSPGRKVDAAQTAKAIEVAGHPPDSGWFVPAGANYLAGESALSSPLQGFTPSWSDATHDMTVDTGEAFVGGAWLGKDTQTTVTLAASTADQTVVVGWDTDSPNTVFVGLESDTTPSHEYAEVGTFDTDGTGVTNGSDTRTTGEQVDVKNRRYEGDGTAVDEAMNSQALGGRSATTVTRDTASQNWPVGRIPDNDRAALVEYVPAGKTFKLTGVTAMRLDDGSFPPGLAVRVYDDADDLIETYTTRQTTGTADTPLLTLSGEQSPVQVYLENDTGSTNEFGGRISYVIE